MFNENGYNIDNLKKLRNNFVMDKDKIYLRMTSFVDLYYLKEKLIPECGTSACIVGHGTRYFNPTKQESDLIMLEKHRANNRGYISFSERLFHNSSDSRQWAFLFGYCWPNSIDQAIARLTYVIDNGNSPDDWDGRSVY